jgi:hypothetical protein
MNVTHGYRTYLNQFWMVASISTRQIAMIDAGITQILFYRMKSVVLTGQEPMRVYDLLKMLAEILGYEQDIKFLETNQAGHYVRTPYSYQPKLGRKYIAPMHVDLGQGLLQLINRD